MLIPVLGFGAFAYLRSAENEQIRAENERKLQEQAAVEAALTSIPRRLHRSVSGPGLLRGSLALRLQWILAG